MGRIKKDILLLLLLLLSKKKERKERKRSSSKFYRPTWGDIFLRPAEIRSPSWLQSSIINHEMTNYTEASSLPQEVEEDQFDDHGGGGSSSHINRLPDELLLLIFNQLVDARCLCKCCLVSKRFSTIIPRVHSVSLTIPPRYSISSYNSNNHSQHDHGSSSNKNTNNYYNLPKKLVSFLVDSIFFRPFRFVQVTIASKCLPRQFNGPLFRAAVESLKKFRNMRRLQIKIPPVQRQDSLCRWQAVFGDDTNICVILFASSSLICRVQEGSYEGGGLTSGNHEVDEAGTNNNNNNNSSHGEMFALTDELLRRRIASANQCFSEASWRNHILGHIVEEHGRMLESAEIIDSEGVGSLSIAGLRLGPAAGESKKMPSPSSSSSSSGYAKVWHFPELGLPKNGVVMQGVSIFAIRHTDEVPEGDEERLNRLMDGAFDHHQHHHHLQGARRRSSDDHDYDDIVYKEILRRRYDHMNNEGIVPITLNLNVRH